MVGHRGIPPKREIKRYSVGPTRPDTLLGKLNPHLSTRLSITGKSLRNTHSKRKYGRKTEKNTRYQTTSTTGRIRPNHQSPGRPCRCGSCRLWYIPASVGWFPHEGPDITQTNTIFSSGRWIFCSPLTPSLLKTPVYKGPLGYVCSRREHQAEEKDPVTVSFLRVEECVRQRDLFLYRIF